MTSGGSRAKIAAVATLLVTALLALGMMSLPNAAALASNGGPSRAHRVGCPDDVLNTPSPKQGRAGINAGLSVIAVTVAGLITSPSIKIH